MEKHDEGTLIDLIVTEMHAREFRFSPFAVLREVVNNEDAKSKLVNSFIAYATASGIRDIAADSFDLWTHEIVTSDDPFPPSALLLWEPVWVLLHETFGCVEAVTFAKERSLTDDDLKALGIEYPGIAAKIGCTQVEFSLDFAPGLTAYLVFKSGECRFVRGLRRKAGVVKPNEDGL